MLYRIQLENKPKQKHVMFSQVSQENHISSIFQCGSKKIQALGPQPSSSGQKLGQHLIGKYRLQAAPEDLNTDGTCGSKVPFSGPVARLVTSIKPSSFDQVKTPLMTEGNYFTVSLYIWFDTPKTISG